MSSSDIRLMGYVGEEHVVSVLRRFNNVADVRSGGIDSRHGWLDVAAQLWDGSIMQFQVKTKSVSSPRRLPWTCTRTGARGQPRAEHGFEAWRYDRYQAEGVHLLFVEADGTVLECVPEECAPRFGCFRSNNSQECPRARASGVTCRDCSFFVFFDKSRMRVLWPQK